MPWKNSGIYAALACISCSPTPAWSGLAEYYSSDHGTVMLLEGDRGYLGQNPAAPNPVGRMTESMGLLTPLEKPPMNEGSCIAYESFTFAIKAHAKAGDTYQCNGVAFRILRCDASRPTCRRFEIEARCFNFKDGQCSPEGSPANLTLTYRYEYDRDKGILSVDFAPGNPRSEVLKLAGDIGYRL